MTTGDPPWVVLHVPHDATTIPEAVRPQFLLDDDALSRELLRMTDHLTGALFAEAGSDAVLVRAPVSRLVVDVERFADDADEPMAARGMGAVYMATSQRTPLRRPLSMAERDALMQAYYHPHHARLEAAVTAALERHGRCLIIDCHSFPDTALPYELADPTRPRPDICIGTDAFHTPEPLGLAFAAAFSRTGWSVGVNDPFAGALVPASRYRKDARVQAVMVEVNRRLYLSAPGDRPRADFAQIAARIQQCCREGLQTACALR